MAVGAAAAAALPYILKIPKYAKMLYSSPNFLRNMFLAGYGVSEVGDILGQAGERGLTKEQLRIQNMMAKVSAEGTERTVKESHAKTKEYIKALMKAKREESRDARDMAAMKSFTESQNRQMALIINAVQALSQKQAGASTSTPGGGMLGLMRGGL